MSASIASSAITNVVIMRAKASNRAIAAHAVRVEVQAHDPTTQWNASPLPYAVVSSRTPNPPTTMIEAMRSTAPKDVSVVPLATQGWTIAAVSLTAAFAAVGAVWQRTFAAEKRDLVAQLEATQADLDATAKRAREIIEADQWAASQKDERIKDAEKALAMLKLNLKHYQELAEAK